MNVHFLWANEVSDWSLPQDIKIPKSYGKCPWDRGTNDLFSCSHYSLQVFRSEAVQYPNQAVMQLLRTLWMVRMGGGRWAFLFFSLNHPEGINTLIDQPFAGRKGAGTLHRTIKLSLYLYKALFFFPFFCCVYAMRFYSRGFCSEAAVWFLTDNAMNKICRKVTEVTLVLYKTQWIYRECSVCKVNRRAVWQIMS